MFVLTMSCVLRIAFLFSIHESPHPAVKLSCLDSNQIRSLASRRTTQKTREGIEPTVKHRPHFPLGIGLDACCTPAPPISGFAPNDRRHLVVLPVSSGCRVSWHTEKRREAISVNHRPQGTLHIVFLNWPIVSALYPCSILNAVARMLLTFYFWCWI